MTLGSEGLRAYSAPGKALVAGGYLVLDRAYDSYVVALSSRMHAVVKKDDDGAGEEETVVSVKSPQFLDGEWVYLFKDGVCTEQNGKVNPFAQSTVSTVLAYINPNQHSKIQITVFSDSGYHSQENTTTRSSGSKQYSYHSQKITDVPKTGLGSSAGLVTVLTTALYSCYSPDLDLKSKQQLQIIHNLAQIAHCQAQGKVGSGFDIAAATFGSIVYKRFDPSLINNLKPANEITPLENHKQLVKLVNETKWGIRNDKVALPNGIRLIMGDIKGGSNTPKLVSKVLKWRSEDPESSKIYNELDKSNMKYVESLDKINKLCDTNPYEYEKLLDFVKTHNSIQVMESDEEKLQFFKQIIKATSIVRSNFRKITIKSGAEIEPEPQTRLLDECNKINGVISGVVPGAGGYDAISLLVEERSVDNLIQSTKNNKLFQNVTWMDLHEEADGIQEEQLGDYIELL